MPSTYSSLLRLELMATGEKNNTWGDITNTNLGTLLEKAIAGTASVNVTAGNQTLTALNGADDQSRCAILAIAGSPGTNREVVVPSSSKVYQVLNGSNSTVTVKGAVTTGVTLAAGERALLAWSGADVVRIGVSSEAPTFTGTALFANIAVSGNSAFGDAVTDTVSVGGSVVKTATGAWTFPAPISGSHEIRGLATANALRVTDGTNYAIHLKQKGGSTAFVGAEAGFLFALGANDTSMMTFTTAGNASLIAPSAGTALVVNAASAARAITINGLTGAGEQAILAFNISGVQEWQVLNDRSTGQFRIRDDTRSANPLTIGQLGNFTLNAPSSGVTMFVDRVTAGSVAGGPLQFPNNSIVSWLDASAGTTNAGFIWYDGTNTLQLGAGNSSRVAVGPSGNVTINAPSAGTTLNLTARTDTALGALFTSANKAVRFDLSNASFAAIDVTDNTGNSSFQPMVLRGSTITLRHNDTTGLVLNESGNIAISQPSSGVALSVSGVSGASVAQIGGSGSPSLGLLDVVASSGNSFAIIRSGTNTIAGIRIAGDGVGVGSGSFDLQQDDNAAVDLVNRSNTRMSFYTNSVERYRIQAGGLNQFNGGAYTAPSSVAFSATPTFDAATSNVFELGAMTASVTAVTINNPTAGQTINIRFKQDGTGGRSVAAPSGAKITGTVSTTANAASWLSLTYSLTDSRWEGVWMQTPA